MVKRSAVIEQWTRSGHEQKNLLSVLFAAARFPKTAVSGHFLAVIVIYLTSENVSIPNTAFLAPRYPNTRTKRRDELERLARVLASGFGVGYLPVAPGTWGSLEAVLLVWLIDCFIPLSTTFVLSTLLVVLIYPAVVLCSCFARQSNRSDPQQIVLDEILGQILCLLWVPISAASLVAGFLLFRLFDIVTPFPARRAEKLPLGLGIIGDDLIAGLYAGICLRILWVLF